MQSELVQSQVPYSGQLFCYNETFKWLMQLVTRFQEAFSKMEDNI